MFQTIAVHHVRPEHRDAMLAFMHRVEEAVAGADGLIDFASYADTMSGRLLGIARWESAEAFQAAMPLVMSLSGERDPAWTERDDELFAVERA